MGKRILGVVVAVFVGYLLYLGYVRYRDTREAEAGAVHSDDTGAREVANGSDDPQPVAQPRRSAYVQPQPATMAAPATDSIAPNPPNGAAFAGTGKFQVYRQGNLTWRVDTETGHTCILFATMEEWQRPIVYTHGCNS